jgi:hypothetical protein
MDYFMEIPSMDDEWDTWVEPYDSGNLHVNTHDVWFRME